MSRWLYWPTTGPTPFVGSIIGNLTLASAPIQGTSAYSPVNKYLYLAYGSTVAVCDLSGSPSVVTTIALTSAVGRIAYLPVGNKVFVLQGAHKYQLIDCVANTAAAQVTMTNQFAVPPTACSSFSVVQSTDAVYLGVSYQFGVLNTATGAITSKTAFASPSYLNNLDSPSDILWNSADNLLYVATAHASHMVQAIDPTDWANNTCVKLDSSTPVNMDANCKWVLNRSTGHAMINNTNSTPKLYLVTPGAPPVLSTLTNPAELLGYGNYDYVLGQALNVGSGIPGYVSVYNSSDALLTHTSIGSGVTANPVAIYCDSFNGRYALQKTSSGEVLQIIAR